MSKIELTEEEKEFRLDSYTLNNQLSHWLVKSKCMWNLKKANEEYDKLREGLDHGNSMQILIKNMFNSGIKD